MKSLVITLFLFSAALALPAIHDVSEDGVDFENIDMIMDPNGKVYMVYGKIVPLSGEAETFWNADKEVFFQLYTRQNPKSYQQLYIGDEESVRNSNFDGSKPSRYIIHGWNSDGKSGVNTLLRDALLEKADVNVIVVDWGKGAGNLIYSISRGRIDSVATVTARLIDFLANNFGAHPSNVLVSGHSLGGHTAGLVGKKITSGTLSRIVALDPAGPGFSFKKVDERVHYDDGDFVEVIHTNAGSLGFDQALGDVDIYPNWGSSQPGCGWDLTGGCAHSRSYEFYAESITSDVGFVASKCVDYKEVSKKKCTGEGSVILGGEPVDVKESGVYYVATNNASPFAQ